MNSHNLRNRLLASLHWRVLRFPFRSSGLQLVYFRGHDEVAFSQAVDFVSP